MSRHGPPGEPYRPGEPYPPYGSYPEPYPDEYAPPSDPWGHAPDPWSGPGAPPPPPGTAPPGPPPPPGAPPGWPGALAGPGRRAAASPAAGPPGGPAAPPGAPPPRRSLGLYLAVAVLVLLAATGVGYALYLLSGDDPEPRAGETPGPESTGQPTGTPGPSDTPRNNVGLSAALAEVGDCLVNDGTAAEPQMRIVRCNDEEENDRFEVLAVFDERVSGEDDEARGASAQAICADTEGYTHHYFEVGEQASFVLCMAEQS